MIQHNNIVSSNYGPGQHPNPLRRRELPLRQPRISPQHHSVGDHPIGIPKPLQHKLGIIVVENLQRRPNPSRPQHMLRQPKVRRNVEQPVQQRRIRQPVRARRDSTQRRVASDPPARVPVRLGHRTPSHRISSQQPQRRRPVDNKIQIPDAHHPAGLIGHGRPPRRLIGEVVIRPGWLVIDHQREPVDNPGRNQRGTRVRLNDLLGQQRERVGLDHADQGGVGHQQLVRPMPLAVRIRQRERAQPGLLTGPHPGEIHQPQHGLDQVETVKTGLGVLQRPSHVLAQRRISQQFGSAGLDRTQPHQQRMHGIRVHNPQAGQRLIGDQGRARPGHNTAIGQRHRQSRQSLTNVRIHLGQRRERRVHVTPPAGITGDTRQSRDDLGGGHPRNFQRCQGGRVHRSRQLGVQQPRQSVLDQVDEILGTDVQNASARRFDPLAGSQRQPGGSTQRAQHAGPQPSVHFGQRKARQRHERGPLDGGHARNESRVGGSGGVQHRPRGRAGQDPAARRLDRQSRDQPSRQRQPLVRRGRCVQHVLAQSGIQRVRPGHSPLRTVLDTLDQLGRQLTDGPLDQPARRADGDDAVVVDRAFPRLGADLDPPQPRQGQQQVRDLGSQVVQRQVDLQRQPDLGREPVRHVLDDRPDQAQHRHVAAAFGRQVRDLGLSPGQRELDATGNRHHARRVRHGQHGREADTELPDSGLLRRRPQRSQSGDTGGSQRSTGVGGTQLTVDESDPQHTRRRTGRVGRVLGQFDEQPVPVATQAEVLFGVRVFAETGGRTAPCGEDRGAQGLGAERVGHSETSRTSSCASS